MGQQLNVQTDGSQSCKGINQVAEQTAFWLDGTVAGVLLGEGARLVLPGRFDSGGQYRPSVLGWIQQLDRDLGLSAGDVPCSEHLALDLAQATKLVVWEFLTEQDYDLLRVNGQCYIMNQMY